MRIGDASGQLAPEFNPFTEEYLGEILEAVAIAWAMIKQPVSGEIEDRITRKLAAQLRHAPDFSKLPFDVIPQYQLDNLAGEYLGRLDLYFKYRQSHRDYFAFEAKRLHVLYPGGAIRSEYPVYVGCNGMGAFVEGPYSTGLPAAGMLGYVMDGDTGKAWNGIAARIESERNKLRLKAATFFSESDLRNYIKAGLPGTLLGETQHALASHILRLFHLLLPVKQ